MIFPITNNSQVNTSAFNVCVLLNGSITIEQGASSFAIPARSFFFFDQPFEIIAASPFLEGFVLTLSSEFLNDFPEIKDQLSDIKAFFNPITLRAPEAKRNFITSLLEANDKDRLAASYTHICWSELLKDHEHAQDELSTVAQFSDLIDQHIEQNYCAGTYAEMMGIPLKKLIREVRKEENKTPCSFITKKVIDRAKHKLTHTDDTSQMIAYQLGFDDPYYFIKYFKKNTDMTPTQYRESMLTV
ncbi:MAG: AraC family transcriptional regulator [Cytophagales bacterium]|nr:AraC family transcriptional regulator [Cytophagales bacterium]